MIPMNLSTWWRTRQTVRDRQQDHGSPEVDAKTVIECDDELLTADTELPSDVDIFAEFQPNSNEDQEEEDKDEVVTDGPPLTPLNTGTQSRSGRLVCL